MKTFLGYLIIWTVIVFVFGCASQFELSQSSIDFRNSLNRTSALNVVATHIVEDSTQKGVCASITYATGVPDTAKFVALNGSLLTFEGTKLEYEGTKSTDLEDSKESRGVYSQQKADFEIDLTRLKRIEAGNSEPPLTYSCHGFQVGYSVKLIAAGIMNLIIHVNADRDQELIAALSYLSPNAKLTSRR